MNPSLEVELVKVRLLNVRCNSEGIPYIELSGKWLVEQGFAPDSRIAVCMESHGKLTIVNLDLEAHRLLEEEYKEQVYIIPNE